MTLSFDLWPPKSIAFFHSWQEIYKCSIKSIKQRNVASRASTNVSIKSCGDLTFPIKSCGDLTFLIKSCGDLTFSNVEPKITRILPHWTLKLNMKYQFNRANNGASRVSTSFLYQVLWWTWPSTLLTQNEKGFYYLYNKTVCEISIQHTYYTPVKWLQCYTYQHTHLYINGPVNFSGNEFQGDNKIYRVSFSGLDRVEHTIFNFRTLRLCAFCKFEKYRLKRHLRLLISICDSRILG